MIRKIEKNSTVSYLFLIIITLMPRLSEIRKERYADNENKQGASSNSVNYDFRAISLARNYKCN